MARDRNEETLVERVDPLLGAVLDRRYRIDERLAAGGFGAIYRAEHVGTKRQVALKVLLPSLTHDPGVVARFRREGATMTALRSPNTITAYELGEAPDGTLYIVMELLRGVSLFERYRAGGRMPWRNVARIARSVCRSLDEAHALGIIHRDLKPTNIHLEPGPGGDEVVKVLDFGIAKILQSSELDSTDLTSAGQMIGTLDYMSPEQMVGSGITGQTDQYTLGIVMYEMVAGQRPFADADSAVAVLAQMLKTNPPPLIQRAPVPPAFDQIVMRCLERESKDRYPDVRALGTALDIVLGDIEAEVSEVTRAVSTVAEVTRALSSGSDALHTLPFDRDADPHEAATVLATGDALNEAATVMSSEVPDDEDHTVIGSARGRAQAQRLGTASEVLRAAPSVHVHPSIGVAPAATTQTTAPFLPSRAKPQLPPPSAAPAASTPPPVYGAPPPAFGAPASSGPPPGPAPQNYVQGYGPPPGAFGTPPPGAYGSPPGPFNAMPQPHYGAPPQPPYGGPMAPYGVRPYDMAASAAREATIRRIVWIVVLAAGTIVGIALATQL